METNLSELKIGDYIQDIAFDFFGGLIPGICAIGMLKVNDFMPFEVTFENEMALLVMAYLFGHFLQPPSSQMTRKLVKIKVPNFSDYEEEKSKHHPLPRNIRLAEKAYAEAVGFWAITFAAIFIWILLMFHHLLWTDFDSEPLAPGLVKSFHLLWFGGISCLLAIERSLTRSRKVKRVLKYKKNTPQGIPAEP